MRSKREKRVPEKEHIAETDEASLRRPRLEEPGQTEDQTPLLLRRRYDLDVGIAGDRSDVVVDRAGDLRLQPRCSGGHDPGEPRRYQLVDQPPQERGVARHEQGLRLRAAEAAKTEVVPAAKDGCGTRDVRRIAHGYGENRKR